MCGPVLHLEVVEVIGAEELAEHQVGDDVVPAQPVGHGERHGVPGGTWGSMGNMGKGERHGVPECHVPHMVHQIGSAPRGEGARCGSAACAGSAEGKVRGVGSALCVVRRMCTGARRR